MIADDAEQVAKGQSPSTHVELVAQHLREMIVTGELPPNSRIRERELAETLDVSRTPVRVALSILEADGLVIGHPNRGFTVAEFTIDDVLSAYDVRGALESHAVRVAIEEGQFSRTSIKALADCLAACEDTFASGVAVTDMLPKFTAANETFHTTIVNAAGRPALNKVTAYLSRMPLVSPTNYLFSIKREEDGLFGMRLAHAEHLPIFDAIKRGQASRAESLMREHIYATQQRLSVVLQSDLQSRDRARSTLPIARTKT
ncbi:GntR family transcriptional regulator [Pseudooceanicola sp. MF1-13]|uniref:GntR family transcriptional regulator n=1 Tax=Pseudooceanicola sp. MF1-13 TaxID=3379095 RepID=UPI0038914778